MSSSAPATAPTTIPSSSSSSSSSSLPRILDASERRRLAAAATSGNWVPRIQSLFASFFQQSTAETEAGADSPVSRGSLRGCSVGSIEDLSFPQGVALLLPDNADGSKPASALVSASASASASSASSAAAPPPRPPPKRCLRDGKSLGTPPSSSLSASKRAVLCPLRISKPSTLVLRRADSSSATLASAGDAAKLRALATSFEVQRRSVAFDKRGRQVLVEAGNVLFSTALPLLNCRHSASPCETLFDRQSLSVLGKKPITAFEVIGVVLNASNDKHLLLYGVKTCQVHILSGSSNSVVKVIDVNTEVEGDNASEPTRCILSADWLPGSETHFAVVTSSAVRLYDLSWSRPSSSVNSDKNESATATVAQPVALHMLSGDDGSRIKSAVFVPAPTRRSSALAAAEDTERDGDDKALSSSASDFSHKFLAEDVATDDEDDEDVESRFNVSESANWLATCIVMTTEGSLCSIPMIKSSYPYEGAGDEDFFDDGEADLWIPWSEKQVTTATSSSVTRTRSLGPGSSLFYCTTSDLLLYACSGASTLMLKLNPKNHNSIVAAFELLPKNAAAEMDLSGPYMWTELPVLEKGTFRLVCAGRDGSSLSGAGLGAGGSSFPRLVAIEYSETAIVYDQLSWPERPFSDLSIEGLVTFTAPALIGGPAIDGNMKARDGSEQAPQRLSRDAAAASSMTAASTNAGSTTSTPADGQPPPPTVISALDGRAFVERAYVAVVYSNGSIAYWAEGGPGAHVSIAMVVPSTQEKSSAALLLESTSASGAASTAPPAAGRALYTISTPLKTKRQSSTQQYTFSGKSAASPLPKFDIRFFESAVNVTDSPNLVYGGEGVNSEATKKKLRPTSADYFSAGSCAGSTLTISLKGAPSGGETTSSSKLLSTTQPPSLVICAIRILVGSASLEYIPRELSIMGRKKMPTSRTNRWYDFPFTDEEIMFGIRNGFVSLGIGAADGIHSPLIDAIEVYAKEKSAFAFHFFSVPSSLSSEIIDEEGRDLDAAAKALAAEDAAADSESAVDWSVSNYASSFKHGIHFDGLVRCIRSLSHIGTIAAADQPQLVSSRILDRQLFELLKCSALDSIAPKKSSISSRHPSMRSHILTLMSQIIPDESERAAFVDDATIEGIGLALADITTSLSSAQQLAQSGATSSLRKSGASQMRRILRRLDTCVSVCSDICRSRPKSYIAANKKIDSLGEGGTLCDICIRIVTRNLNTAAATPSLSASKSDFVGAGFESLIANVLEFAVLDMTCRLDEQSEKRKQEEFFGLLIAPLLNDRRSSKMCCKRLSKVLTANRLELLNLGASDVTEAEVPRLRVRSDTIVEDPRLSSIERLPTSASGRNQIIAYQCDGCNVQPIPKKRYTLPGENIDLCSTCYQTACAAANAQPFSRDPVSVGAIELARSSLASMEEAVIADDAVSRDPSASGTLGPSASTAPASAPAPAPAPAAAAPAAEQPPNSSGVGDAEDGNNDQMELEMALRMSMQTDSADVDMNPARDASLTRFEDLTATMFPLILSLFEKRFADKDAYLSSTPDGTERVSSILHLLLSLGAVPHFGSDRNVRIVDSISTLIAEKCHFISGPHLTVMFQALSHMLSGGSSEAAEGAGEATGASSSAEPPEEKTDPRFVCTVHRQLAVRRRSPSGESKDRRFYICGMPEHERCDYFQWADNPPTSFSPPSVINTAEDPLSQKRIKDPVVHAALVNNFMKIQAVLAAKLQAQLPDLEDDERSAVLVERRRRTKKERRRRPPLRKLPEDPPQLLGSAGRPFELSSIATRIFQTTSKPPLRGGRRSERMGVILGASSAATSALVLFHRRRRSTSESPLVLTPRSRRKRDAAFKRLFWMSALSSLLAL